MAHYNYIDVLFRRWGEEFYGKSVMDLITDEQVEKARIWTMEEMSKIVKKCGSRTEIKDGTIKTLFLNRISSEYNQIMRGV